MLIRTLATAAAVSLASAKGVTLLQVDDFSSGTAGWAEGRVSPNKPGTADTGLAGGPYLTNTSAGGGGAGSRMVMWNDAQWTGDYLSAGIVGIAFEARSVGDEPFDFRFAFNGPGGWFTTPAIRIDDFATGPDLTPFFLPVTSADLSYVIGGTGSFADTMGAVTRMEIISATGTPDIGVVSSVLRGDVVDAEIWIDNIRAIPEPGSAALVLLGALIGTLRRRRPL